MEWTVVTALAVLVGLIASVTRPLLTLNSTIARLTASVEALEKNLAGLIEDSDESREKIADHELRLRVIESR
ncbi:MAG: hypothetical protein RR314_04755 [Oscillospiraceae bacterium]